MLDLNFPSCTSKRVKPLIPQMKADEELDKMKEEIKGLKEGLEAKTKELEKITAEYKKTK